MTKRKLLLPSAKLMALAFASGLLLAAPASLASADSSETNSSSVSSQEIELQGTATGDATAGPVVAFAEPIVIQTNAQINATNSDDVTQTASNDANIGQISGARSGDAAGTNGGTASSGAAVAGTVAIVHQLNVQVVAGRPCGSVNQDAANVASVGQAAAAVSGNAGADGEGSSATSGDASAVGVAFVNQQNVQVSVHTGLDCSSATQQSLNNTNQLQLTGAGTGNASAADGGSATTGDANARSLNISDQSTFQFSVQ